ncbi:MAG: uracil-DNA glycosylase [Desulfatiglandales bacterium]
MEAHSIRDQLSLWIGILKAIGIEVVALNHGSIGLGQLEQKVLRCRGCELYKSRKKVVFGEGNPQAELMFIGEAPGAEEDLQGRPFVGASGQLLTKMIKAMGLEREEVYIANILKCRPPSNRDPNRWEIGSCLGHLKEQIRLIAPSIIVTLGRIASRVLLGLPEGESFTHIRGKWTEYEGIPLMPTYHPSYLLRNPEKKKEAWEDLKSVMKRMGKDVQ